MFAPMLAPMEAVRLSLDAAREIVGRAAAATGADFSFLLETARRESGLRPGVKADTSSATGLFQFIESTWLEVLGRHGAKHGQPDAAADARGPTLSPERRKALLALRTDPELSARLAGELAQENAARIEARIGRAPDAGELYAAHVLGAGGAVKLIEAAARGAPDAAALFPEAAAANRGLFYAKDGAAVSPAALLERFGAVAGRTQAPELQIGAAARSEGLSPAAALFLEDFLPSPEASDPLLRALGAYARGLAHSLR